MFVGVHRAGETSVAVYKISLKYICTSYLQYEHISRVLVFTHNLFREKKNVWFKVKNKRERESQKKTSFLPIEIVCGTETFFVRFDFCAIGFFCTNNFCNFCTNFHVLTTL